MARTLDKRNLASAAIAILLGAGIAIQGAGYPVGSLTQMGPGFFPMTIGIIVVVLGIVMVFSALRDPEAEPIAVDWRPLVVVSAALVVFGLALERLGLAPATLLLVTIASLAQPGFRPRLILGVSLFMIVLTGLVFVYGLGMPVSLVSGLSL